MPTFNELTGGGSYNEGKISRALALAKRFKNELDAGKITQAEYVSNLQSFLPDAVRFAHQIAGGGSAKASAATAAGLNQITELGKEFNIYKSGQDLLGRDLTKQELAEFAPRFNDVFDTNTGKAYLAEIAKQEASSPQALAKKAPQYSGQIGGYYQQLLSRGASNEEADYFGRLLATGQVTPYEIQEFIKATPEYQTTQDKQFRQGLESELAGYDEKAFARERENILSQYTKAGLQNSSALDFAITDALGKVQEQRGQFLSGLSAQQYGGNKAAARQDYQNYLDRYQGGRDYERNRSDAYLDYLTQRSDQASDYRRQKDDYLQFLAAQPKQKSGGGWGGLAGGLIGLGIGATIPGGAGAGYQIGSGLGQSFDYLR